MNEFQKYISERNVAVMKQLTADLPDKGDWTNRFEIKSATSNRVYTIAKRKSNGTYGCSCPGWLAHRNCKHLKAVMPLILAAEQAIKQKQIG